MNIIGIDIGGTKCTVILGKIDTLDKPSILGKRLLQTSDFPDPYQMIVQLQQEIQSLMAVYNSDIRSIASIGICCGGPLDSVNGVVLSPPNLPGWDEIPIVKLFSEKYNVPVTLQNDANACALAEWKFGAGRGKQNVIFMTFGTGMGAGLILNGKLYSGTNDNAGEIGHLRLSDFGPVGYGKSGSFEGFCSGGGIAQLARIKAMEKLQNGIPVGFCKSIDKLYSITAISVALAAEEGDELALEIYNISGMFLGKGLAILIDILNPEIIVIGSIYERSGSLLKKSMMEMISKEALSGSLKVCRIVPAALGDSLGEFAALSVAVNAR
jgi:glucokinase